MAKISGGTRSVTPKSKSTKVQTAEEYNRDMNVSVNSIKEGILQRSRRGIYEENGSFEAEWRFAVMQYIEDVASGNYGLASTIAKQAVARGGGITYGYYFSDKQAYVIAKALYDNKLLRKDKDIWLFEMPEPNVKKKKIKVKPTQSSLRNK